MSETVREIGSAPQRRKQSAAVSIDDVRCLVEGLVPDPEQRSLCLSVMADYIRTANRYNPASWNISTLPSRQINRVNVGGAQVCYLAPETFYVVLDGQSLDDNDRALLRQNGRYQVEQYKSFQHADDLLVKPRQLSRVCR